LLLDPIVSHLEKRGISRGASIIGIGGAVLTVLLFLVILAVPQMIREYRELIQNLPGYSQAAVERLAGLAESFLGIEAPHSLDEISAEVRSYLSAIGVEQVKTAGVALSKTALHGYSIALTLFNLMLLPFFVFYIGRDLGQLHRTLGSFLDDEIREKVASVCREILRHVYAFFEGQLTVSLILAVLYIIGFSLVGLPWAVLVGTLTGLLNIVPYLGVAVGFLLATVLALVSDPSLTHLLIVYGVFAVIQIFEGNFLTPKIVGESVGIHPLGVMVALIVGGDLFGLLGMILAIPAAAAVRVLFQYTLAALEDEG
jgi:predicted PurR-regulated permease PerM